VVQWTAVEDITLLSAVLLVGSVARLTRLASEDTITQPIRDVLLFNRQQRKAMQAGHDAPAPKRRWASRLRVWVHGLVTCPWCVSIWLAAGVVACFWAWHDTTWMTAIGLGLTASYVTGWLAGHE